eukprot:31170-Pelagococcus_subviridis.AAC.10
MGSSLTAAAAALRGRVRRRRVLASKGDAVAAALGRDALAAVDGLPRRGRGAGAGGFDPALRDARRLRRGRRRRLRRGDLLRLPQLHHQRPQDGRDVRHHEPRARSHERRHQPRGLLAQVRLRGVLELGQELKQMPSKRGQRVRGIPRRESTDETNREQPNLRALVVQRDEQRSQRVRLTEVRVHGRTRAQKRREHGSSNVRVQI